MRLIQPFLAIFLICTIVLSCSPERRAQRQLKRANNKIVRLVKKHPGLLKKDTIGITVRDTIVIDSIHADTTFHASIDTITLERDRFIIRYVRVGDSILLSGTVKGDTIYRDHYIEVIVEKIVVKEPWFTKLLSYVPWWVWLIIIAAIGYFGREFIKGVVKKILKLG